LLERSCSLPQLLEPGHDEARIRARHDEGEPHADVCVQEVLAREKNARRLAGPTAGRDHLLQGETSRALGKTRMLMGDYAGARECLKDALGHFEAMRSKVLIAVALRTLAEVTFAGGWGEEEERNANNLFLRAIAISEELNDNLELAKSLRSYAEMLTKQGKTQPAEENRGRAEKILSGMAEPQFASPRESARIEVTDKDSDISIDVEVVE
jgi:tetratricopeptide (TPR) repeat protein